MSVILRPDFPSAPHRIDAFRGATRADIAHTRKQVELIFSLFEFALKTELRNLSENLPIGDGKFDDILAYAEDLESETVGRLQNIEDKCDER